MSANPAFKHWWETEGRFSHRDKGPKFATEIAWSNGAYLARHGELPVDYRRMKKALPDRQGLWAYRLPGASESVNVAITRGIDSLYMHRPNGGTISLYQWARLFPKTRWREIS